MAHTCEGYLPGKNFEENTDDALVDIELTDSTELWLIQWPVKQLKPHDFQGKELSLKLHRDGKLGSFECSSGKSYDVVSYAAQKPDATVFMPSSSESNIVGKISRRVCLVNYPEPGEFEKPSFSNANRSSQRGSRCAPHHSTFLKGCLQGTDGISRATLTSADSTGERSLEAPQHSRKKRHEDRGQSSQRSSHASRQESHVTDTTAVSEQSHGEKSKKMKMEE